MVWTGIVHSCEHLDEQGEFSSPLGSLWYGWVMKIPTRWKYPYQLLPTLTRWASWRVMDYVEYSYHLMFFVPVTYVINKGQKGLCILWGDTWRLLVCLYEASHRFIFRASSLYKYATPFWSLLFFFFIFILLTISPRGLDLVLSDHRSPFILTLHYFVELIFYRCLFRVTYFSFYSFLFQLSLFGCRYSI